MATEAPRALVFRWQVPRTRRRSCAACGIVLVPMGSDRPPLLQVSKAVSGETADYLYISPLCWRCWQDYQADLPI